MSNINIDKLYDLKAFRMLGLDFTFGERSNNEKRHCSRCGAQLDDPASWERGIGPICANKSTHIFSRNMKADMGEVQTRVMVLDAMIDQIPADLHNNVKNMFKYIDLVSDKVKEGIGIDFRPMVRVIDYCCSYEMPVELKNNFISLCRALGFPALAAVLSGEASTGEASVKFNEANGRIELRGSSCKSGARQIARLGGCTMPKYRGSKEPFTAPAAKVRPFLKIVETFWPMFDGGVDDIIKQAEEFEANRLANLPPVEENKEVQVVAKKGAAVEAPTANIHQRNGDFTLTFPFSKETGYALVAKLKTIPWNERNYSNYVWSFTDKNKDKVVEMVSEYFNISLTENLAEQGAVYSKPGGYYNRR